MCDCGRLDCSFCTNQTNHWINWRIEVEKILSVHKPGTRINDMRLGQRLFNLLTEFRPRISTIIAGSIVDPFHNDDKIRDFLDKVDELWTV